MKAIIKPYLQLLHKTFYAQRTHLRYNGAMDVLYHHGQHFRLIAEFPTPAKNRACFSNCYQVVEKFPWKFYYAEGLAVFPGIPIPIEHAWLVEKKTGAVVDITLRSGRGVLRCDPASGRGSSSRS